MANRTINRQANNESYLLWWTNNDDYIVWNINNDYIYYSDYTNWIWDRQKEEFKKYLESLISYWWLELQDQDWNIVNFYSDDWNVVAELTYWTNNRQKNTEPLLLRSDNDWEYLIRDTNENEIYYSDYTNWSKRTPQDS